MLAGKTLASSVLGIPAIKWDVGYCKIGAHSQDPCEMWQTDRGSHMSNNIVSSPKNS